MSNKQLLLSLAFVFSGLMSWSQNLASNPSFESYSALPTGYCQANNCNIWNNVNGTPGCGSHGSPDYYHTNAPSGPMLPNTSAGTVVTPYDGNAVMGFLTWSGSLSANYREYVGAPLTQPMVAGQTYTVSFQLTNGQTPYYGCGSDNIGIHFSNGALTQIGGQVINVVPQVEITNVFFSHTWQFFTFTFTPTANFTHMTIGNFENDANTATQVFYPQQAFARAYYYIDDISITTTSTSVLAVSPNITICEGDSTTLTATGDPSQSYSWADDAAPGTILWTDSIWTVSPTVTTTYNVYGSTDTASVTVTVDPSPTVNLGNDTSFCQGGTLLLDATNPGATYSWQNNSTAATFSVTQSGTYWVDVSIGNCTASDTINVTVNPPPVVDLGNDTTFCQGGSITLDATLPGATYVWQDNSTGATYPVNQTGTYSVDVTLNGCVASDVINVTVSAPPVVDLGNDTTICQGASLTLDATTAGATYLWQDNSTGATYSASQAGVYSVDVSIGGCTASDAITIAVDPGPIVDLGNDTSICVGTALLLDATAQLGTYVWQDNSTNASFNANGAGTYWVEVTSGNCSATDSIVVTELQLPTVALGNDTTICEGNSLVINPSVQDVSAYLWSTNETTSSISVAQSGVYSLEGSNACGSDADTMNVTVEPIPAFSLGNDTTLCAGASLTLVANVPNTTTTWQNGSQATSLQVTQPGVYSAVVNGQVCSFQDDIQISFDDVPNVQLGLDTIICDGDQLFVTAASTNGALLWSTGSQESTIVVNAAGIYTVSATNNCGQASDQIEIQTRNCSCELYIPNTFTPDDGKFNETFGPVHECVIVEYTFRIFNRWGEVIFESTDPFEMWDGTYLDRKVQVGTYTYQLIYSTDTQEDILVMGHVNVLH